MPSFTSTEGWIATLDELSLTDFVKKTDIPDTAAKALESGDWELLLHQFAVSEYSVENIEFLRAVAVFESSGSLDVAAEIYRNYVSTSAPQQVNLPDGTRKALDEIFGPDKEGVGPPSLFDQAKLDITRMINNDTYVRFTDGLRRAKAELKRQEEEEAEGEE